MTEPLVLPIGLTVIDFQSYLKEVKRAVGRAPCVGIDTNGTNLKDLAKYTASLAEFQDSSNTNTSRTLSRPGAHLKHTFFSFLIVSTNSVTRYITENTDLDIITSREDDVCVLVASGNLQVWKNAVVICLDKNTTKRVRETFTLIRSFFTQFGLDSIWSEYRRKTMPDTTYFLEYKLK